MASDMNLWTAAGLVYVLAGAALLCNALFLSPAPMQAPEVAERDPLSLQRVGRQWLDTRVGAVLIVLGFFLQTTGALGTPTLNGPGALVLLALAFARRVTRCCGTRSWTISWWRLPHSARLRPLGLPPRRLRRRRCQWRQFPPSSSRRRPKSRTRRRHPRSSASGAKWQTKRGQSSRVRPGDARPSRTRRSLLVSPRASRPERECRP